MRRFLQKFPVIRVLRRRPVRARLRPQPIFIDVSVGGRLCLSGANSVRFSGLLRVCNLSRIYGDAISDHEPPRRAVYLYSPLSGWAVALRSGVSAGIKAEVRPLGQPIMRQVFGETEQALGSKIQGLPADHDILDDFRR